jgi:hypothetical protein
MKKTLNILMLATGFLLTQACGKKSSETTAETTTVEKSEVVLTAAEKRSKIEKQRKERKDGKLSMKNW